MQIKSGVLVGVIFCMGITLFLAISSQDEATAEVVGAIAKSQSLTSQPAAVQHEQAPDNVIRLNLAAIKRTMPGNIRNNGLFQSRSWYAPPPTPLTNYLPPPPPPPPPRAPQLPFTFIGRMIDGNEVILFLAINDQQYIAKLGDVLDGSYRVDEINEKLAVLTYLPLNIRQELEFNSTAVGVAAVSVSGTISTLPLMQTQQLAAHSR